MIINITKLFFILILFSGLITLNVMINLDEISYKTTEMIRPYMLELDNHDIHFKHNFCESKLQNNNPPEIMNAYTSLIISIVPFIYGFPNNPLFYNVACMLSANGFASFHYHYYLTWIGKQGDEISMILANYFGMWGLINMYYKNSEKQNILNRYNTAFMYLFLLGNTLIEYDPLFPSIFGIYVGGSLVMIYKVANMYNIPYIKNLFISFIGASCWIISEHFCNENTKYGHPIWHCLFPFGFYKLILDFDKKVELLPEKIDN
tara:strand:+ start:1997 stop:2782 length:786 start_codon:yes stop_codon:yes gene_type:complete